MSEGLGLVLLLAGWTLGYYTEMLIGLMTSNYRKWRMGICFHYEGKGYREIIDGTSSEFCRKCGHPHGYHR